MKSRVVVDATLYDDIGQLAGWSIDGTGITYIRDGAIGGDIVLVIDADVQPTGTLVRNLNIPSGAFVDVVGTATAAVLYFD